jgi:hypothetical protein
MFATEDEIRDAIVERITALYREPLMEEMKGVFNASYSIDEARSFFLFPSHKDMSQYPAVLMQSTANPAPPSSFPIYKVQKAALSMLYLVHIKNWDLCSTFMIPLIRVCFLLS